MSLGTELKNYIPRATLNMVVALFFYILSEVVPTLFTGVKLPGGVPEPFDDVEWLTWVFLFLLALIFFANALLLIFKALDPLLEDILTRWRGDVKPAKRVVRDLAYMILILLVSEVLSSIAASLEGVGVLLRLIIGFAALILLIILVYDLGKTTYSFIESKIDDLLGRLVKG